MGEIQRWACLGRNGLELHPLNTEQFQPYDEGAVVMFTDHERVVAEAFAAGREAGLKEAKEKAERVLVEHLGKRKLTRPKLMIDLLAALSGETD